jgi:hypothetical protein
VCDRDSAAAGGFGPSEFALAREMAENGEEAVLALVPRIRRLLSRLDAGLFPLQ